MIEIQLIFLSRNLPPTIIVTHRRKVFGKLKEKKIMIPAIPTDVEVIVLPNQKVLEKVLEVFERYG